MAGDVLVSYGGGVNSVAVLVLLQRQGVTPAAIVMADPGSEHVETVRFRDGVLPLWLDAHGFPRVTVIDRITEGQHVARAWRLETLEQECLRIGALPSIAYGWKKCSAKYKGDTSRWWAARQSWTQAIWQGGGRVRKVIGYDAGESQRVKGALQNPWENERFVPWYPLVEAGLDRDGCIALIESAGLPVPPKSACTFCPNNTLEEWEALRRDDPSAFERAVSMSRNAAPHLTAPDTVGLMRCNPHGKRQLHVWADGGYPPAPATTPDRQLTLWELLREETPCECVL